MWRLVVTALASYQQTPWPSPCSIQNSHTSPYLATKHHPFIPMLHKERKLFSSQLYSQFYLYGATQIIGRFSLATAVDLFQEHFFNCPQLLLLLNFFLAMIISYNLLILCCYYWLYIGKFMYVASNANERLPRVGANSVVQFSAVSYQESCCYLATQL